MTVAIVHRRALYSLLTGSRLMAGLGRRVMLVARLMPGAGLMLVAGRRYVRGRRAQGSAHSPAHRKYGEHGQHHKADTPLREQDHVPSISRMRPFLGSTPQQVFSQSRAAHKATRRSRSALAITETELKLMATAAIMGLNNTPRNGYRTPAAIGTPAAL